MDFDLSADQEALQEAAAALLDRYASPERVRAHVGPGVVVGTLPGAAAPDGAAGADDRGGAIETDGAVGPGAGDKTAGGTATDAAPSGYDRELWAAMTEQGWTAAHLPEDAGGLGLGMVEVAVLCEQIGRHVAPAPYLPTVLAAGVLAEAAQDGSDHRSAEWASRLAAGEAVGCVAWSASPGAVEVAGSGAALTVTGRPDPVAYGPSADIAVVAAGDQVVAVDLTGDGVNRPAPEPAMDRTRELGWLVLDGAPAWRLGGPEALERLADRGATTVSAELLGSAARALELSVQYAKDRVQFGKPIGSFQAVKHRLADALVDVEGMRSSAYYAAWCTATDDPEASLAASMAKAWCSDASARVMTSCLQVHGGIGFTWEHDLHLYVKRAQLDQVSFGDAALHRDRITSVLTARMAKGERIL